MQSNWLAEEPKKIIHPRHLQSDVIEHLVPSRTENGNGHCTPIKDGNGVIRTDMPCLIPVPPSRSQLHGPTVVLQSVEHCVQSCCSASSTTTAGIIELSRSYNSNNVPVISKNRPRRECYVGLGVLFAAANQNIAAAAVTATAQLKTSHQYINHSEQITTTPYVVPTKKLCLFPSLQNNNDHVDIAFHPPLKSSLAVRHSPSLPVLHVVERVNTSDTNTQFKNGMVAFSSSASSSQSNTTTESKQQCQDSSICSTPLIPISIGDSSVTDATWQKVFGTERESPMTYNWETRNTWASSTPVSGLPLPLPLSHISPSSCRFPLLNTLIDIANWCYRNPPQCYLCSMSPLVVVRPQHVHQLEPIPVISFTLPP
jgi:hypothetical protein